MIHWTTSWSWSGRNCKPSEVNIEQTHSDPDAMIHWYLVVTVNIPRAEVNKHILMSSDAMIHWTTGDWAMSRRIAEHHSEAAMAASLSGQTPIILLFLQPLVRGKQMTSEDVLFESLRPWNSYVMPCYFGACCFGSGSSWYAMHGENWHEKKPEWAVNITLP